MQVLFSHQSFFQWRLASISRCCNSICQVYKIKVELNTETRFYYTTVNGNALPTGLFFQPLASIDRVVFRTGHVRRFPDADTPTDQDYDLPRSGEKDKKAAYYITSFKTSN